MQQFFCFFLRFFTTTAAAAAAAAAAALILQKNIITTKKNPLLSTLIKLICIIKIGKVSNSRRNGMIIILSLKKATSKQFIIYCT